MKTKLLQFVRGASWIWLDYIYCGRTEEVLGQSRWFSPCSFLTINLKYVHVAVITFVAEYILCVTLTLARLCNVTLPKHTAVLSLKQIILCPNLGVILVPFWVFALDSKSPLGFSASCKSTPTVFLLMFILLWTSHLFQSSETDLNHQTVYPGSLLARTLLGHLIMVAELHHWCLVWLLCSARHIIWITAKQKMVKFCVGVPGTISKSSSTTTHNRYISPWCDLEWIMTFRWIHVTFFASKIFHLRVSFFFLSLYFFKFTNSKLPSSISSMRVGDIWAPVSGGVTTRLLGVRRVCWWHLSPTLRWCHNSFVGRLTCVLVISEPQSQVVSQLVCWVSDMRVGDIWAPASDVVTIRCLLFLMSARLACFWLHCWCFQNGLGRLITARWPEFCAGRAMGLVLLVCNPHCRSQLMVFVTVVASCSVLPLFAAPAAPAAFPSRRACACNNNLDIH